MTDGLRQRRDHLSGAAEPFLGRGADGFFDGTDQRLGKVGTRIEERPPLPGVVGGAKRLDVAALDRVLLRQQVEQRDADGVDVARDRRRLPAQQLGAMYAGVPLASPPTPC